MRASSDVFVVGITGIGTALFLTQLLIVGQQITSANNRIQAELAAEKAALPFSWMGKFRNIPKPDLTWRNPGCCPPFGPPIGARDVRHYDISSARDAGPPTAKVAPTYPERAIERDMSGYVDFIFTLMPDGSVADPQVIAEVPQGYGFANAAVRVFARWRFQPDTHAPGLEPLIRRYRMNFRLSN